MDFSVKCGSAIAQNQVCDDLTSQVSLFAPQSDRVRTPQRKAKYSDKQRIRLKDAKSWVLRRSGCSNTTEIKKYLKILGKKLDLRLTSAWVAIYKELADSIRNLVVTLGAQVGDRFRFVPVQAYLEEIVGQISIGQWEIAPTQTKSSSAE